MDKSKSSSSTTSTTAPGVRKALATIQTKGGASLGSCSKENEMVGRKAGPVVTPKKKNNVIGEGLTRGEKDKKLAGRVSKVSGNSKPKKNGVAKVKYADQAVQTLAQQDLDLLTAEEPPEAYWKQLAEARGKALEESLTENEYLHKRIADLQAENLELEELVGEAKKLAELVQLMGDPDEEDGAFAEVESDNSEICDEY